MADYVADTHSLIWYLGGGGFTPLEDIAFFKKVKVDPEVGTLVWPNGADLCLDVLYSEATGTHLPVLDMAMVREVFID